MRRSLSPGHARRKLFFVTSVLSCRTIVANVVRAAEDHPQEWDRSELAGNSEGVEGGDGFDEAGDGEGVANAARLADHVQNAISTRERNRGANQSGNAGAVDLRHAVEIDDDLAGALFQSRSQRSRELVAGFADGEPADNFKDADAGFFARVDFDGSVLGHWTIGAARV